MSLKVFFLVGRKFKKIKHSVDVAPFLAEIEKNRASFIKKSNNKDSKTHKESEILFLRAPDKILTRERNLFIGNITKSSNTKHYPFFTETIKWIDEFVKEEEGEVGRVVISILQAKGRVRSHFDQGLYFALRDRYHLVVKSDGTKMIAGGEEKILNTSEVWWFNNKIPHEVFNESENERIHLIFDILPHSHYQRLVNCLLWLYYSFTSKIYYSRIKGEKDIYLTKSIS